MTARLKSASASHGSTALTTVIAAFPRRVLLRIEALVDHDTTIIEENRAEDVGIAARARHVEQLVGVVELDAKLQILLDDVIDGDRRLDNDAACVRILS